METNAKNATKVANEKIDNLNLNLSLFSKAERGKFNYSKIFENRSWFLKNRILNESDVKEMEKMGVQKFVNTGTDRYSESFIPKKKIRRFSQNLNKRIESEIDPAVKLDLQKNADIFANFAF
jgi:hypothetical protein